MKYRLKGAYGMYDILKLSKDDKRNCMGKYIIRKTWTYIPRYTNNPLSVFTRLYLIRRAEK